MVKKKNKILEFFRPTIAKLAITLIIFLVFVPVVSIDSGARCATESCESESKSDVSLLIYAILLLEGEGINAFGFFYVSIIAGAVVSYVLSCFVVILVDFLKEKFKDI
jgi:hypothetical protein